MAKIERKRLFTFNFQLSKSQMRKAAVAAGGGGMRH